MAATSTAMNNPRHLAVNMLRLLAVIEKTPAGYNCNSIQRLREQIDVLHRMRPTVALPDGLDMENVDRRIDAILELERIAKLAQHQCGEVEPSLSESKSRTDQVSSSHTQAAASAAPANEGSDEEDMRMALLTPKGAPSRKKIQEKSGKAPNGGSVSMQVLRIESISKMNKQLQSGMHDIRNSAIKDHDILSEASKNLDSADTENLNRELKSLKAAASSWKLLSVTLLICFVAVIVMWCFMKLRTKAKSSLPQAFEEQGRVQDTTMSAAEL